MPYRTTIINGKRVGRFRASWLLLKETWRFLRLDPEILLIPLIAGLLNILFFAILVSLGFLLHFTVLPLHSIIDIFENQNFSFYHVLLYIFIFVTYVISAFTLAFSQGAIAHTVITRLHGENATLRDSLKVALHRWRALLTWSIISSTVGIVLGLIARKSSLIGRLVLSLIGVAWEVLTYFVAPAITIENKSSIDAIKQSGRTLKQTFGETVMTNIGLSLALLVFYITAILVSGVFLFIAFTSGSFILITITIIVIFLLFLTLGLLTSALQGVLKTILYTYVMEHSTPPDFNSDLLQNVIISDNQSTLHTTDNTRTSI